MQYSASNIKLITPWLLFTFLTTLLIACDSKSINEIDYSTASIIQLDESQSINQSVDLILYFPDVVISNIQWLQTAGNPVSLLSENSKVIAFTPTLAGEYSFSVSFLISNGADDIEYSLEKTVTVIEDNHPITARLSHEVLAENQVSFRSQLTTTIDNDTLTWLQISGPSVSLTTDNSTGELVIFFDAPAVEQDTLITFVTSANDAVTNIHYQDQVAVLVEPAPTIASNAYFSTRKASVFPYQDNSPYAQDLVECIYSNTLSSSCTFAKTPLLASEVIDDSTPLSIDDIMDRVLVSHQWMGDNFKAFLNTHDTNNDFKNLLRATTAIVIAYDIRPSFYWAATGAIYLDAENLWLTPNERDTINEAEDFRSDFGNDLQFLMPWRYVKNNAYANQNYDKAIRVTRTTSDILYRLSALLYHELAHANDFFPSDEWYSHSSNQRVLDAAQSTNFESDELAITHPLQNQTMYSLAEVRFSGEAATSLQISYAPADIETFFSTDKANDFYAYSSEREDYAMLFEELMMQNRFGVMRDVAITNNPTTDEISTIGYPVTWGQRGRIGDEALKDRALFTASRVLPEFDSANAIALLSSPIAMIVGNDWFDNLAISPNNTEESVLFKATTLLKSSAVINEFTSEINAEPSTETSNSIKNHVNDYYHKPLPTH